MSKEEAMKLALDALESCSGAPHWPALQPVITALREELAEQPAQVEVCCGDYGKCMKPCTPRGKWLAEQPAKRGAISFNCSAGCGACGVKLQDFVTHQTQVQEGGPWVVVDSQPEVVSTCCGSPVEVWDEQKQDIVARIEALKKQPAQPAPVAQQEPVARIDSEPSWHGALGLYRAEVTLTKKLGQFTDLYTTPQAPKEKNT